MTRRIAHYTIVSKLGEGAMGVVYKGIDENLQMPVAIKVLDPSVVNEEESLARFEIEAKAAARLKHNNIAHVFYIGRTNEGLPFYAMEYIDGTPLDEIIAKHMGGSGRQILSIMMQTIAALGFAKENDVLHRDIKPGNIMITSDGTVKLVDFGLAKVAESDSNLTKTGTAVGTPNYISPELAKGEKADFRSDMYSAGIAFFELLTGNIPYTADNPMGVLMKHVQDPVPILTDINPQYPAKLARIIEKMIAKAPRDRYLSFDKIGPDLQEVMDRENKFLRAEWNYCRECGINTFVKSENLCSTCGASFIIKEKVKLCTVSLVGFTDEDSKLKVIKYLKRTTKRPLTVVQNMVEQLPLTLAKNFSSEKAERIKAKFDQMGARLDIETCGSKIDVHQTSRMPHSLVDQEISVTPQTRNARKTPQIATASRREIPESNNKSTKTSVSFKWIAMTVVAVVAILSVVAIVFSAYTIFFADNVKDQEVVLDNSLPPLKPAQKNTDNESDEKVKLIVGDIKSQRGYFDIHATGCAEPLFLETLANTLEVDLSRIGVLLGSYPQKTIKIKLDGSKSFTNAGNNFGLSFESKSHSNKIKLFCGGLNNNNPLLRPVMIAQISQQIVREWGGKLVPYWFEVGFSLYVVNKIIPGSFNSKKQLQKMSGYLPDQEFMDEIVDGSHAAFAQAESFVAYLGDTYQIESLKKVAKMMGQNVPVDKAFEKVFNMEREVLMKNWFAQSQK